MKQAAGPLFGTANPKVRDGFASYPSQFGKDTQAQTPEAHPRHLGCSPHKGSKSTQLAFNHDIMNTAHLMHKIPYPGPDPGCEKNEKPAAGSGGSKKKSPAERARALAPTRHFCHVRFL